MENCHLRKKFRSALRLYLDQPKNKTKKHESQADLNTTIRNHMPSRSFSPPEYEHKVALQVFNPNTSSSPTELVFKIRVIHGDGNFTMLETDETRMHDRKESQSVNL